MASQFPGPSWQELKRELMEKWHELTESELDRTLGNPRSIVDLLEKKVGLAIDEASEKYAEIASHYRLYNEPEEEPLSEKGHDKPERIMELKPKKPAKRDVKPRGPFKNT